MNADCFATARLDGYWMVTCCYKVNELPFNAISPHLLRSFKLMERQNFVVDQEKQDSSKFSSILISTQFR